MAALNSGPQQVPPPASVPVPTPTRLATGTGDAPVEAPPAAILPPAAPAAPPYVPFDKASQTGAEYFASLVPKAAQMALPPGYTAVPTSGYRPGAIAADTGQASQHATGGALDFAVLDPQGRTVPGAGLGNRDPTGHYRAVAVAMRQLTDPDMQPWMAWGGNFGLIDPGHVDFGGDRGARGKLATIATRR